MKRYMQAKRPSGLKTAAHHDYYYNVFEAAYDAIFVETLEGEIVDVNGAACEMLLYSRDELLQMNIKEILPAADKEIVKDILQREAVTNGKSFIGYNVRKDGTEIPVEVRVREFYQDGRQYLMVLARDISERMELLAKEQEQTRYLTFLHEISVACLNRMDLPIFLKTILQRTCEFFGTANGLICVLDETLRVLKVENVVGMNRYTNIIWNAIKIGEGVIGKVAETGQPLVVEDYPAWAGRHKHPSYDALQTCVGIPLKSREKTFAVICLDYFDVPKSFSSKEMEYLQQVGEFVALVLANANLHISLLQSEQALQEKNADLTATHEELQASEEELRQQFEELMTKDEELLRQNMVLNSLHDTAISLMNRLELDDVLTMIIDSAAKLLGTYHGWIYLLDREKKAFVERISIGIFAQDVNLQTKITEGLAGQGYKTGDIMVIEDYSSWEQRIQDPLFSQLRTVVQMPLKVGNEVIGVCSLAFLHHIRNVSSREIRMLSQLAQLASLALDNANLVASYKAEIQERRVSEKKYKSLYVEYQQKESLLTSLINSIPDLIFYKDKNSVFLGCNHAFEAFAGRKEQDLIGLTDFDLFDKQQAEFFRKMDIAMMCLEEPRRNEELVRYPNGDEVLLDTLKTPYYDPQGNVLGLIGISRDITERKKKEEEILYLSYNDILTGLYNRTYFEETMKRLDRVKDSLGVMICDVDGLKIINDTLGHTTGDLILKAVATILKNAFREGDIVARIGGDEFAVLLDKNAEAVFAAGCQRIRRQIELYNHDSQNVPISLSIGFAVNHQGSADVNDLFKEADNNMYREKLHRQKSTRSAIVQALLKALEARDFITEGHGDRVQDLLEAFAAALGLSGSKILDLRLFSQFHDIGKVGIPDNILFKPGKLTAEEFLVMQRHCEIGYRIAKSAPDLEPIADWILKHHEWWDGHGYPFGLKKEEIPLSCRMLSIVDAYDAMTNDRPYRKAMPKEEAMSELKKCAGSQFDPSLVELFVTVIETYV